MKRALLVMSAEVIGVSVAWADIGNSPCPPGAIDCASGHFGFLKEFWWCCQDSSHTKCVNYFRDKWLCNSCNPGDPAAQGYTIRTTTDSANLNWDSTNQGSCF
jgi:hypothetical protein